MTKAPQHGSVTVLTCAGRSAVASLSIDGANQVVATLFRPAGGRSPLEIEIGQIAFGFWRVLDGHEDEVVVCRRAPDTFEVHCHGGQMSVAALVKSLLERGVRQQPWTEWIERSEPDPISAEARIALSSARTRRAAEILLEQMNGALATEIERIDQMLSARENRASRESLLRLLSRADLGLHLATPWRIVLAGPANVGKSSLMNALAGFQRAIVFDQPGTTRDVVSIGTALDGWAVELADTAGLREAADALEMEGIELARDRLTQADLVVYVFDRSEMFPAEFEFMGSRRRQLIVHNKCDIARHVGKRPPGIDVSALRGDGLADLMASMVQALVPFTPNPGDAVPFTRRQVDGLRLALTRVDESRLGLARNALDAIRFGLRK